MEVEIRTYRGTVQELAEALRVGIVSSQNGSGLDVAPAAVPNEMLSPETVALLDGQGPRGGAGILLRSFLTDVLRWGDVDATRGKSAKREDGMTRYIMLHRRGSNMGAFVYVRPKSLKLTFRLPASAAKGSKHATTRNVKSIYQVDMRLNSDEAKAEALRLAKNAYDAVM